MQLSFKAINRTLVVSIVGEIDHHTSEDVRNRIDSQIDNNIAKNLVFDFTKVNFMDSAGIGVILGRYKKISSLNGKVAIVNAKTNIKRILEISGMIKICNIYNDIDSALTNM